MKISDQGFSERISSQPARTDSLTGLGKGSSSSSKGQVPSDNLQLSGLASLLQSASVDSGSRSARISQISQALNSGTFQFNPSQISSGLVSEAVSSAS